jgi:hypothetical protein
MAHVSAEPSGSHRRDGFVHGSIDNFRRALRFFAAGHNCPDSIEQRRRRHRLTWVRPIRKPLPRPTRNSSIRVPDRCEPKGKSKHSK